MKVLLLLAVSLVVAEEVSVVLRLRGLTLANGDDPCEKLWEVCEEKSDCLAKMRPLVSFGLEASSATWTVATQRLRLSDSYFCGCCARNASFGENLATKNSRELLNLLREAILTRRPEPLAIYNEKRLKLLTTSLLKARHFGDVSRSLPRNSFVADRLALALRDAGKDTEADGVLRRGVEMKLWPSIYQRPITLTPGLRAKPFWDAEKDFTELTFFQRNSQRIADIVRTDLLLGLVSGENLLRPQAEGLVSDGWEEVVLRKHGRNVAQRAETFKKTLEALPATFFNAKISVLHPNTTVAAHCGPSNARLRAHLAIAHEGGASIRVANEPSRTWTQGDLLVFDDSFEHAVDNKGTRPRIVLILDFWHPDLPEHLRDFQNYGVLKRPAATTDKSRRRPNKKIKTQPY